MIPTTYQLPALVVLVLGGVIAWAAGYRLFRFVLTVFGFYIGALAATAVFAPALAHVTLEQNAAPVGSFYKAVLRVPHGCDGSATTKLSVQIPEGIISVKPMVKSGWTLQVTRGAYAKPYSFLHGAKFTEGPKEVIWSGGNLPDAYYDEFVLSTFIAGELPAGGSTVQDSVRAMGRAVDEIFAEFAAELAAAIGHG